MNESAGNKYFVGGPEKSTDWTLQLVFVVIVIMIVYAIISASKKVAPVIQPRENV